MRQLSWARFMTTAHSRLNLQTSLSLQHFLWSLHQNDLLPSIETTAQQTFTNTPQNPESTHKRTGICLQWIFNDQADASFQRDWTKIKFLKFTRLYKKVLEELIGSFLVSWYNKKLSYWYLVKLRYQRDIWLMSFWCLYIFDLVLMSRSWKI
jgi:hypothetical protein